MISVQLSHVHGNAIGSGRTPAVIWELKVEGRGVSAALEFFEVRAVGSNLEEGVRRLGPAPAVLVVSIIWISSSESRVRSVALLWTLSFAAFSASL